MEKLSPSSMIWTKEKYDTAVAVLQRGVKGEGNVGRETSFEYKCLREYQLINVGESSGGLCFVIKKPKITEPGGSIDIINVKRFVHSGEFYEIIKEAHVNELAHVQYRKTHEYLEKKYINIPRQVCQWVNFKIGCELQATSFRTG